MNWTQDAGDYSWFAKDSLGYFYRVQKVADERGTKLWVCAWSERNGFRLGCHAWHTADEAKDHMNWIASDVEENPVTPAIRTDVDNTGGVA